jgi:hypothetical protein
MHYELRYFYKFLPILLIPFLFDILIKQQRCFNALWQAQLTEDFSVDMDFFFHRGEDGEEGSTVYYNVSSVEYAIHSDEVVAKYDRATLSDICFTYGYYSIRFLVATHFEYILTKLYRQLGLLLIILSFLFITLLLFY